MKKQPSIFRSLFIAIAASALAAGTFAADILIYGDHDFVGNSMQLKRSDGNVQIGTARSVRVTSGVWEACTGPNFGGTCVRLTPGDYREIGGRWGVGYASFRDVTQYGNASGGGNVGSLQLFTRSGYRGATLTVDQEIPDLNAEQYAIVIGSARVSGSTSWEACTDINFRGRCQVFAPGDYNEATRMMRDRVLSIRPVYQRPPVVEAPIPRGNGPARVELYTGGRFGGMSRAYTNEAQNLNQSDPMFNDSVSSIRVTAGEWELCQHPNYTGACLVFGVGEYQYLPPQLQRQITSIRPIAQPANNTPNSQWIESLFGGTRYNEQLAPQVFAAGATSTRHPIWLFEGRELTGRSLRTRNDIADLRQYSFNDVISSVFVTFGNWELCSDLNYGGRCYVAGPGQHFDLPFGRNGVTSIRRVR